MPPEDKEPRDEVAADATAATYDGKIDPVKLLLDELRPTSGTSTELAEKLALWAAESAERNAALEEIDRSWE